MAEVVVALMVRVPVPGRVKTRLAAGVGEAAACTLYVAMVADALAAVAASGLELHLVYDGNLDSLPAAWLAGAAVVRPQRGGDIGARMAGAFEDCLATGCEGVILAGSDLPDLEAAVIRRARAALAEHGAVLAPSADGGYGLIGLGRRTFRRELFAGDIPWSTDRVLTTSLERFDRCGLAVHLLGTMRDIDTPADLEAYRRTPCPAAVRTNHVLARLLADPGVESGSVRQSPAGR